MTDLLIMQYFQLQSQNLENFEKNALLFDSIIKADAFSTEHSNKFGQLVIQDTGGRMKPANTFSSELLRKVSKKDNYNGLNSDQVLLSIMNKKKVYILEDRGVLFVQGKDAKEFLQNLITDAGIISPLFFCVL